MGINGLMSLLREKHPYVFKARQSIKGIAYVDTPLIVMSCGMVGMTNDASLDPYDLLVKKLQLTVHLLYEAGAQQVKFVFDGPTRPEKIGTCIKRQDFIQRQAIKRQREDLRVPVRLLSRQETSEGGFEIVVEEYTTDARDSPPVEPSPMEPSPMGPSPMGPLPIEPSLEVQVESSSVEPLQEEPTVQPYALFANAAKDHVLFSDLYISTMIACGKDVGMLKDLSKFAKNHLQRNGMEVLHAPHDSESYIATLLTEDDVAVTCDSDALPFGCGVVAQNIGSPKETWVNLQDVLEALRMDMKQFRIFCVMLGTDFNARLPKCGPAKALKCITSFSNFEDYCMANAPKTMTLAEKLEWVQAAEKSLSVFELKN